ncbi:MAG: hypothetical protein NT121_23210, partial [Chloroflexi bacterium]|nr:hypothetical protein [Chloroflexota bacterium]
LNTENITGSDKKLTYYYTNIDGSEVAYKMDQPMPSDGDYEILVMDTLFNSFGKAHYDVFINDQLVPASQGTGDVNFKDGQPKLPWMSVGIYHFAAGQRPEIKVKVMHDSDYFGFSATRMIIGLLPNPDAAANPTNPLSNLPSETATADLSVVPTKAATQTATLPPTKAPTFTATMTSIVKPKISPTQTVTASPTSPPTDTPNSRQGEILATLPFPIAAWWNFHHIDWEILEGTNYSPLIIGWMTGEDPTGGQFQYLPENSVNNSIRGTWGPPQKVAPGKYKLYVWVPTTHATISQAEYYLLVDGKPQRSHHYLDQNSINGQWESVQDITLDTTASVQVVLLVKIDNSGSGEIGVSLVALSRRP